MGGIFLPSKSKLFYNITLLDKTVEHLKQNEIQWKERINRYDGVNDYCNENYMYNYEFDVLHEAKCKCYNCERCRPIKKYDLLNSIVKAAEKNNLRRHLVITLSGYPFRSLFCNADESFDYAMKKFNEFRVLYKRCFGNNLSYICLPRSQKDGFCHLHILIGNYIPKDWLDNVLKRINLGFPFITYVDIQRLGNYLSKYWYKDHEWYIPENKKHYTHSTDIELESFVPSRSWYYIGLPRAPFIAGSDRVDCIYRCLDYINPYHNPPPLDFMLGEFYRDLHKNLGNNYISNLRKHGINSPSGNRYVVKPHFSKSRQTKLFYNGRSYYVTVKEFIPKRFTRQKKFKRDNKWKSMYEGEIKLI